MEHRRHGAARVSTGRPGDGRDVARSAGYMAGRRVGAAVGGLRLPVRRPACIGRTVLETGAQDRGRSGGPCGAREGDPRARAAWRGGGAAEKPVRQTSGARRGLARARHYGYAA